MNKNALSFMALSSVLLGPEFMHDTINREIDNTLGRDGKKIAEPKNDVIQNGMSEYFFNASGEFSTERMLRTECVFKCYSLNAKNAKKKFDKWKRSQR